MKKYETIIGLEVHAELLTETKMFCSCPQKFGGEPNTRCCPVCLGLPGALPVLNRRAVDLAVLAGLATSCDVATQCKMDRKNYFYPDLPKAYQISQMDLPLCRNGYLTIDAKEGEKRIGITRIHMEEDAGKLIHDPTEGTLIDFNRCGVPLIEIVSEPDLRSAEEALAYLQKLRSVLLYVGASDCRMNEGSFRCDVNLSVRPVGEWALGVRTELKNLNSFSFTARAIEYEAARQINILEAGGQVLQETRRFDPSSGKTLPMRSKEDAADYRYFPEPDLPYIVLSREHISALGATLPMLPDERRKRYREVFGVSAYDASLLVSDRSMADYFEAAAPLTAYPKLLANLMITDLMKLNREEYFSCPISPAHMAEVADLLGNGAVNSSTAKKLTVWLWKKDQSPRTLVEEKQLSQIRDESVLRSAVTEMLAENPKLLADYRGGKLAAAKAMTGRVMAKTEGRADPLILDKILKEELSRTAHL
ncbi:MAG: Asp-tRNA(Asn)/Glu-tRNA(Gln) amidotransferase subunit GatB [Clostridia bacterium]|nr:Asp-tRNA(Asn)/Glu-tRNA(Gln) amidotransferase subunit GatB [Clostridia bacterium]